MSAETPYVRLCWLSSCWNWLLCDSQIKMLPFRFSQLFTTYLVRTRYNCDSFGLMRVNVPSALKSSMSKLIFQCWVGRAQRPSKPEYSLIGGTASVAGVKPGIERKLIELSAFSMQPAGRFACDTGSPEFTTAQEPRAARAAVGPG